MGAVHELTAEHMDEMLDFFESSAVSDESPMHDAHPFVQLPAQPVRVQNMTEEASAAVINGTAGEMKHGHVYKHHSHAHALGEVHSVQSVPVTGR